MKAKQIENQLSMLDERELSELIERVDAVTTAPNANDVATQMREFHGWTLDKLEVFELYLKMFRRVAGSGGAFIDAFAGTGYGESVRNGRVEHFEGSGLRAAMSGAFATLDLIEMDEACLSSLGKAVAALSEARRSRVRLHSGDCNLVIPKLLASGQLDESKPCFALLDQESTQLKWATIETLAGWKTYEPPAAGERRPKSCKVELWILFNSHQVINRLWPNDRLKYPDSFSPKTLDRIMGSRDAWWDLWVTNQPASALVERFAERLRSLGYVYAIPQVINDPDTGRPQYHMFHATDHPSAVTLMRWARRASCGFEDVALPGFP